LNKRIDSDIYPRVKVLFNSLLSVRVHYKMRTEYVTPESVAFSHKLLRIILPQKWERINQFMDGLCYLCLYEEKYHQKVAYVLGYYPCWGEVKNLGGFKVTGSFNAIKLRNDIMHISTDGIGVPARDLSMCDDDVVGASRKLRLDKYIVRTWPLVFPLWYMRLKMGGSYQTTLPMLFLTACLVSPTWIVLMACGKVVLPNPSYWLSYAYHKKSAVYRSIKWKLPKMLYILGSLAMIYTADARLGLEISEVFTELDNLPGVSPEDMDLLKEIHPRYMDVYNPRVVPFSNLCTDDYDMRGELLDLDLDDEVIIQYLEVACQDLAAEDNWHHISKVKFMRDPRFDRAKYARPPSYKQQITKHVNEESEALLDSAGEIVMNTLNKSKEIITDLTKERDKFGNMVKDQGIVAIQSVNTAVDETAQGLNKVLMKRAKQIKPLIEDVDGAVTAITKDLSMKSAVEGLSDHISNFRDEIMFDVRPGKLVNGVLVTGAMVANDAAIVATNLYSATVNQLKSQTVHLKDASSDPLTLADITNTGKEGVKSIVRTGEVISDYVKSTYADNNIKENTAKLIGQGPWLAETLGQTIGKLPNGVVTGANVTGTFTELLKNVRESTIGLIDTPEQKDARMEYNYKVRLERAKTKGSVLSMFRGWSDKPVRDDRKKKDKN